MKRMLMKKVEDAIADMVGLIKTYRSKKRRMTQFVVSTLFKRRMAETEVVISLTFTDLMVSFRRIVSSSQVFHMGVRVPNRCCAHYGSLLVVRRNISPTSLAVTNQCAFTSPQVTSCLVVVVRIRLSSVDALKH